MTRNALVVDDAATVRMYHGGILSDAGFDVEEAANGYEGLEVALSRAFDLLVVDVNMPRMDGYELVSAVRRDGPNQTTPILMVSTEDEQADADRGYACGATMYVGKPVKPEILTALAGVLAGGAA